MRTRNVNYKNVRSRHTWFQFFFFFLKTFLWAEGQNNDHAKLEIQETRSREKALLTYSKNADAVVKT